MSCSFLNFLRTSTLSSYQLAHTDHYHIAAPKWFRNCDKLTNDYITTSIKPSDILTPEVDDLGGRFRGCNPYPIPTPPIILNSPTQLYARLPYLLAAAMISSRHAVYYDLITHVYFM